MTITGTNASETITGTNKADVISAGNGNDIVNGSGGNDIIEAGNGNDTVDAGAGNDIVDGGNGNDVVNGGAGNDILVGGNGDDTLDGGSGSDLLSGDNGNDILIYRAAENLGSVDVYDGGNGQDTLRLIVNQTMANSTVFKADIAALQAKLNHGSGSYSFNSFNLIVTSIEKFQVIVEGGNINHAPTVAAAIADQSSAEDALWSFTLPAGTFADVDGNALTYSATLGSGAALPSWLSFNAATKTFSGTPPANFNGAIDLKVTVSDGSLSVSDTFTLTVTAVNDAPETNAVSASGNEDTVIAVALSASDVDGTIASFQITTLPAHGAFYSDAGLTHAIALNGTVNATTVYFRPDANWSGATAFQYVAIDNSGLADATPATASIAVAAAADVPVIHVSSTVAEFTSAANFSVTNPFFTTVGDFNGDGKLDLAVSNFPPSPGGSTVSIMLGDGAGHFGAPTAVGAGAAPNASTAADLNGDGKLDLAVVNQDSANVSILLGNGDGTFVAQPTLSAQNPTSVVAADFNEDGILDLAVGMSVGNGAKIFLGNGNGTFQSPTLLASGNQIGQVAVGDLNGDGNLDLVAAVHGSPPRVLVMLGDGHGNFAVPASFNLDSTGTAVSLTLGDLNGDGKLDLVAANTGAPGVAVLLGDGSGGLGPAAHFGSVLPPNNTQTVVIEDFNGDGRADLAVANPAADSVSIMLGNGDGTFQPEVLIATGDLPVSLASGDFNGDGRVDLVASNYGEVGQADSVTVLLGGSGNATVTGTVDAPITLNLSVATPDTDGSESVTVKIDGVPSAYALNHGVLTGDGSWIVDVSELGDLVLQPASGDVGAPGSFQLTITATSVDGSSTASAQTTMTVVIALPANALSGLVQDGYVAGATVFSDTNDNGLLDDGELFTTTAADGSFTLIGADPGNSLVMVGGTDISTGLPFQGVMKAPGGSTVVTPLTTLVAELVSTGQTVADAQRAVKTALNLADVDLTTYDAVAAVASGDAQGAAVLSAAVQVQATVTQITAAAGPGVDVVGALANAIATATTPVNLSDAGTVAAVATASGADSALADAVSSVVAAANTTIAAGATAGDATQILTSLSQAATVALGTTTQALATTDFNDAGAVTALQANYTGTALTDQVAAAPVAVISLPILGSIGNDTLNGTASSDAIDGLDGNDAISGGAGNDQLYGGSGNDKLTGGAGDDSLDGGAGRDRASYLDAAGGVTINLAAGTVHGTAVNDVAGIGSDTLHSIELVQGSNLADTFDGTGFGANSANAGSAGSFNVFEGMAGDDIVTGNGVTTISYQSATAGVAVDLAQSGPSGQTGAASGDASVGNDIILGGVGAIQGSAFADTLRGTNTTATVESFIGGAGDDLLVGRGGLDRAIYATLTNDTVTGGVTVNLAAGTVTGDASVGTDTLKSIEFVRGSNFADVYDATGFSGSSANAGSNGTFNEIEGMGGADVIIGNGNTRIAFYNATAGVTVDLAASGANGQTGTASGDNSVGSDIIKGGINAILGSQFADNFYGSNNAAGTTEQFDGRAGNDFFNGRGGLDQALYNTDPAIASGISVDMAAGTVTGDSNVGTDTLRSIESVRGTNFADSYVATGFDTGANFGNFSLGDNVSAAFNDFEGLGGDDVIFGNGGTRINFSSATAGVTVNLTAGTASGDASVGHDTFTGVERVRGSNFGDIIFGDNQLNNLDGQGGDDRLDGRGTSGTNVSGATEFLTGGAGADTFVYANGYGLVNVLDFNRAQGDKIDLSGVSGMLSFADVQAIAGNGNPGGTSTLINFGGFVNTLFISNVAPGTLQASDFIFGHAPTDIALSNSIVAENSANSTVVGSLSATDTDSSENFSFALTSNPGNLFAISGNNLVVAGALDYEAGTTRQIDVRVTDKAGYTFTKTFTVNLTDVNDVAPTITSGTTGSEAENTAPTTVVYQASATDPDTVGTIAYSLSGDDAALFDINGATGAVTFKAAPDFEVPADLDHDNVYSVVVHANDGIHDAAQAVAINVTNVSGNFTGTAGDNLLPGSTEEDTVQSLDGNDKMQGYAGNDFLDGGNGRDRAIYSDANGGVTINLAAGTASGAGIGSDTLRSVEFVTGSSFIDTFNAASFGSASTNAGSNGAQNSFEGLGGDDIVHGNTSTQVTYMNAAAAVTVTLDTVNGLGTAHGTALGDAAGIGSDALDAGVTAVRGSNFNDTLTGSNNVANTAEQFNGGAGDDVIDGQGGFDRAQYSSFVDDTTTAGITVNLAAGTVSGDISVGADALRSVEGIRGSNFDDVYNAVGFTTSDPSNPNAPSTNASSVGLGFNPTTFAGFNEFEGMAGNDTITGNGVTRISYANAGAGVTANLASSAGGLALVGQTGFATGTDVGTDTIKGGVNWVIGSQFDDVITGRSTAGAANDTLDGQDGNDVLNGGAGADNLTGGNGTDIAVYSGNVGQYNLGTPGQIIDTRAGSPDGTDNFNTVEVLQFADTNRVVNSATIDLSVLSATALVTGKSITAGGAANGFNHTVLIGLQADGRLIDLGGGIDTLTLMAAGTYNLIIQNVETLNGSSGSDSVTLQNSSSGLNIDLGGGTDTLTLAAIAGTQTLNVSNTESVIGTAGIDTVQTTNGQNGTSFDLGGGIDTLNLANANNVVTVTNVETIQGATGNDTVTFFAGANTGQNISLGSGIDVLILGASGSYAFSVGGSSLTVNGTVGQDSITLQNSQFGTTFDLGDGIDTLQLSAGFGNGVTVRNVESVIGSAASDAITITNTTGVTTVTAGAAADFTTAGAAEDHIRFTSITDSPFGGGRDTVTGFDADHDYFEFSTALVGGNPIHFIGNGDAAPPLGQEATFDANGSAEARLANIGGLQVLQIDVNGDGQMTGNDMEIALQNLIHTLHDGNFLLV
jgi:Ca2+-binding RTX toxin-like protein